MIMRNTEPKFIESLLKRLKGAPVNIFDRHYTNMHLGETVKVFYDTFNHDYETYITGVIKYDLLKDEYFIRLARSIPNFNSDKRNLYFGKINEDFSSKISHIISKHEACKINEYEIYKYKLDTNPSPYEFYQAILDLYYDDGISLFPEEVKFLSNLKERFKKVANIKIDIDVLSPNFYNEKEESKIRKLKFFSENFDELLQEIFDNFDCEINLKNNGKYIISDKIRK